MGPARMANRLAGVTRSRSVTPDRSSKIVLKPGPLPLAKASRARMPGRKRSRTFPAGRPAAPTRCLSSGVNRARYRIGVEKPTTSQTGLRSSWIRWRRKSRPMSVRSFMPPLPEVSWSGAPVVAGPAGLGGPAAARARVPQGPAGLAQEHVVQAGLGQPERPDGQARLVEQPEQPGQGGRAVAGVQPDRVALHGEVAHGGLPGQLGGRPRGGVRVAGDQDDRVARHLLLQRARGAFRDHRPVIDDHDAVAEHVGLVQVVRGQEHRGAPVPQAADVVPQAGPVLRVESGARLVQEQDLGLVHDAERHVEPPPLASGVRPAPGGPRTRPGRTRPAPPPPAGRLRRGCARTACPAGSGSRGRWPARRPRPAGSRSRCGRGPARAGAGRPARRPWRCPRRSAAGWSASAAWWFCRRRSGPGIRRSHPG